jgi:hypothetical protein
MFAAVVRARSQGKQQLGLLAGESAALVIDATVGSVSICWQVEIDLHDCKHAYAFATVMRIPREFNLSHRSDLSKRLLSDVLSGDLIHDGITSLGSGFGSSKRQSSTVFIPSCMLRECEAATYVIGGGFQAEAARSV